MMGQKIQTYLLVTAIAVLVWLFAENQNVKSDTRMVTVRFVPPQGQDLWISPSERQVVQMTFLCATRQLDQVRELAANPVQLVVGSPSDNGTVNVLLKERLQQNSPFSNLVEIVDVEPKTIQLHVEQRVEVQVPIQILPAEDMLVSQTAVEPATAKVRVPASQRDMVSNVSVVAKLASQAQRYQENVTYTESIPLSLPDDLSHLNAIIEPATANVTFRLSRKTETVTLVSIPIRVVIPIELMPQYTVLPEEGQGVVRDVRLVGPSDEIEKIANKETRIWAELRLSPEELDSGIKSKVPFINKPPGVNVESEVLAVQFNVIKRQ